MAGDTLEKRVVRYIREYGLVSGGEKVIVAVSGGQDSICLLHLLNVLSEELGISLHVAHLDHSLRGEEGAEDASHVIKTAENLGIPVTCEKRDAAEWQAQKRCSLEEAAREVRYRFLNEVADNNGANLIATGHTRDDQVETILMHYLRGSGLNGLRGLRPATSMPCGLAGSAAMVIRPLLDVTRRETLAYCGQHGLKTRVDSTNQDIRFLRNRIRLELIPLLKQYNPEIEESVLRFADISGEDSDYLEAQACALFGQTVSRDGGIISLDAGKLRGVPLALQRRILRMAMEQTLGSLRDIENVHTSALVRLLSGETGKSVHLPGGMIATNEHGRMVIVPRDASSCPWPVLNAQYWLNIPGETKLPGWTVEALIMNENFFRDDDIFSASFDLDKAGTRLYVRGRQAGDRFHPLGMQHSRKLQDFMVDAAIPRAWRNSIPLLCTKDQIAWVVGWRIDDRVKVSTDTQHVLRLQFHREEKVQDQA